MLLRRFSKHVEDQNWFAVALDFVIVVIGVFMGFQLNNWNEARRLDNAYREAQTRLISETRANLSAVNTFMAQNEALLPDVRAAIDVLRRCGTSPADEAALLKGLQQIRGTMSLKLRMGVLDALTHDDGLLSRQTPAERERLSELFRTLSRSQETLDWLEQLPFDSPVEDDPLIGFGEIEPVSVGGIELASRKLTLAAPLEIACRDNAFAQHFYIWERTATFQNFRAAQVTQLLEETLQGMGAAP